MEFERDGLDEVIERAMHGRALPAARGDLAMVALARVRAEEERMAALARVTRWVRGCGRRPWRWP